MRRQQKLQLIILLFSVAAFATILNYAKLIADWLQGNDFITILDQVSKLSLLVAVITFLWEIPKRQEKVNAERQRTFFDYWQVIDAAAAAGITTSHARKIALENLAKAGVKLRNIDAPKAELRQINLTGADLIGANLEGADLTSALLNQANLSKADLSHARLYGTSLVGATLENVNLRGALYDENTRFPKGFDTRLSGALLIAPGTSLAGVKLPKAKLWGVNLRNANLTAIDLSEASCPGAFLQNANFEDANLQGANFQGAHMQGTILQKADIRKANFWAVKGLTAEQVKLAHNWQEAIYPPDFSRELGLNT